MKALVGGCAIIFLFIAGAVFVSACAVCFYIVEVAWAWEIFRHWLP